jgi:CubicO group peptidase (beta-lactamase class C family)
MFIAGQLTRIIEQPLQFQPGSRFGYSNDCFIMLGAILERRTRQLRRLRPPARLPARRHDRHRHPRLQAQPDPWHGPRVRAGRPGRRTRAARARAGLDRRDGTLRESDEVQIGNPSGGGYTTVGDPHRFARALMGHRLLSPALTDTVLTGKVDSDRPGVGQDHYAYGFADSRVNGVHCR